jgi:hypothetical protein
MCHEFALRCVSVFRVPCLYFPVLLMALHLNAEVFDFAVIQSSTKLTLPMVSSLVEELKILCPNKVVTQSKWLDVAAQKLGTAEAQCYWTVFASARGSILGQFGEWIDIQTLGILLLCQCFPNARARADSFHRAEVLAQSLAATAISPSSNAGPMGLTRSPSRNNILNISKLLRDNSSICQFVVENVTLFIGMITVCLLSYSPILFCSLSSYLTRI